MTDPSALPADEAPEYPSPSILDSRRLMGANVFSGSVGALLEVVPSAATPARIADWRARVQALCAQLHWPASECVVHVREESAQLFLAAPVDGLMTATSLNEAAWAMDEVSHSQRAELSHALAALCQAESQHLGAAAALVRAGAARTVNVSLDDETVSVGSGRGVMSWPIGSTPSAPEIAWDRVYDVPTVLVTGSNGKTTTTRLIAAMWRSAQRVTGWCCSDGAYVATDAGVEALAHGDYTGPGGARLVLRDARVEAIVLETARGGLLRRGLAVSRADVALITNISADHFGEYGVESLSDLAQAKAVIAHALIVPRGMLVLNAMDDELVALTIDPAVRVVWFASPTPRDDAAATARAFARVASGVAAHGFGAIHRDGALHLAVHGVWHDLGALSELPITFGGAAPHNAANAMAAALAAAAAGVAVSAIAGALQRFGRDADDNAGRLMIRMIGGVTIVMDYAHNPDGMAALCATAGAMPARRRLLLLGQAGNRDDAQLRALGAAAWRATAFDRVIIKDMHDMLRGRAPGEIPARLREGLRSAGAPEAVIVESSSELAGIRSALEWAADGDLLVLGVHVSRPTVLALMDQLASAQWRAGDPLPTP